MISLPEYWFTYGIPKSFDQVKTCYSDFSPPQHQLGFILQGLIYTQVSSS